VPQLISTLQEVCGTVWVVIASAIGLLNVIVASVLVFKTQSVVSLVAFKPVTFLPLVLGVFASTTGLLQSIEISVSDQSAQANPALLLAWGLLPLLVGGSLSAPAFVIAALGRLWLATRSFKKPQGSEPSRRDLKEQQQASDESAYQSYADFVNSSGHRKGR